MRLLIERVKSCKCVIDGLTNSEIGQGLLVYCGLDTYALVKLWEKFKEVVEE